MVKDRFLVFAGAVLLGLLIFAVVPVFASSEDCWVSKAPMHQARGRLGVAVVNGKIYAIGGTTAGGVWPISGGFVGTNEEYDPATDTWTTKTPMPTTRYSFAVAVYQGKIYCIGGITGLSATTGLPILTGINEVYDPAIDMWETKTPIPTPRLILSASVVEDKMYLISGYTNEYLGINEVYDPKTDSWYTASPMPNKAANFASTVFDNKIYIIGGYADSVFGFKMNQIYDPEMDYWSQGIAAPYSISNGAAGATTGVFASKRIYVMGVQGFFGPGGPPCLNRVYDPQEYTWSNGTTMHTQRLDFGIAVVDDTLYVIGGHTYTVLGFIAPSAANEQYLPIGYGTPDPTYPTPTPTPTPTLTPTPTPTQSQTPTSSPSLSPTSPTTSPFPTPTGTQTPTSSSELPASTNNNIIIIATTIAVIITIGVVAAAVLLNARHRPIQKRS